MKKNVKDSTGFYVQKTGRDGDFFGEFSGNRATGNGKIRLL